MPTYMHTYIHIYIQVLIHTHIHNIHTYTHTGTNMVPAQPEHTHTYIHAYIHTYIHTGTHMVPAQPKHTQDTQRAPRSCGSCNIIASMCITCAYIHSYGHTYIHTYIQVLIWFLPSQSIRKTLNGHPAPVEALAFSRDGVMLTSGDVKGIIFVWEANVGQ